MNWPVLIVTGIALVALLVFLIRRNFKDERKFEKQFKNDYRKTKDEEGDVVVDEELK
jgi:FtsZ-interacting cell division protein ZipA